MLQSIGVQNLFDFHEEELAKNASDPPMHHLGSPIPMPGLPTHLHAPSHSPDYLKVYNLFNLCLIYNIIYN